GRGGGGGGSGGGDQRQSAHRGSGGDRGGDPRRPAQQEPSGRHRRARPAQGDQAGADHGRARRGRTHRGQGPRGLPDRGNGEAPLRRSGGGEAGARRKRRMSAVPPPNRAAFTLGEIAALTGGYARGPAELRCEGVHTDTRTLPTGAAFVALRGAHFDAHDFLPSAAGRAALAIVRRGYEPPAGLDLPLVWVEEPLAALGALARAHRARFSIPLGAITGSNGKTTTKELAASVFEAAFGETLKTEGNLNNEIGLPLTLLRLDESHRAACVEMGMNHPGEIARLTAIARPRAGLVTCAPAVHLSGLGSGEGVARAKGELYAGLDEDAVAVVNADDPRMVEEARRAGRRTLSFGSEGADVALHRIVSAGREGIVFEVRLRGGEPRPVRLRLVGAHNVQNACAAMALGLALGAPEEAVVAGIEAARGVSRRLQLREAPGGVTVLDD